MSLITSAIQKRLPKVISPRAHGVIDYAHSAFFLGLGLLTLKSNKRASNAAFATSAFILVQSLLTDYPLGVQPLITFEQHGTLDKLFASSSWAIPQIFGFAGTPAARVFEVNSFVEGSVVQMTDWSNSRAVAEKLEDAATQL